MKQLTHIRNASLKYFATAVLFLSQTLIWAQETTTTKKTVDVDLNVDDGSGEWYVQPWAWVVGAAIFIIIIVALLRGKSE
ncbi:MAG: hypothetical protein ABIQ27_03210 [Flavobacterium sp.]|uniref:hypothetical protein n=1 Tax=Flavobacterium sp. TaxID=239 RepID=UPI0032673CA1